MKLEITIDTKSGTSVIPNNRFYDELKDIIRFGEFHYPKEGLSHIRDRIQKLKIQTKTNTPNFKIEMWYVHLQESILTIRFGHEGDPQITIKEIDNE